MRIYGNRALKTLPGSLTRPTAAKVRTALFNIWRGVEGSSWLDICAGSGSMGAEALGRGATVVIGIEQSGKACRIVQENWQKIAKTEQEFQVLRGDCVHLLQTWTGPRFDWIYFDPPYASGLYLPVLQAIATQGILKTTGALAVEHDPKQWEGRSVEGLVLDRQKQYGNTMISFYRWEKEE